MVDIRPALLPVILIAAFAVAGLVAWLVFGRAGPPPVDAPEETLLGPPGFAFQPTDFSSLDGWASHDPSPALPAFIRSCERLLAAPADAPANLLEALGGPFAGLSVSGFVSDWRPACEEARPFAEAPPGAEGARAFFERHFSPLRIMTRREAIDGAGPPLIETRGLFTGYFEPVYNASRAPTAAHSAPVYARPDDLVMVDLGRFRSEYAGVRLAGSVVGGNLVPYPDHRDINEGAISNRTRPLAYMDPNDLLFLQIQGSGRLRFWDGAEMRVGYDGQNGHPYTAIGRFLVERGVLPLEEVSMQTIRLWLDEAPPEAARALREENASYVFFRRLDDLKDPGLGPPGAGGDQLDPGVSLAVDRRYHALGAPVWVTFETEEGAVPFRRLMIAQDTGGAIRGPVRGDVFFGAGPEAGEIAGRLRAEGEMTVLIPAAAAARFDAATRP